MMCEEMAGCIENLKKERDSLKKDLDNLKKEVRQLKKEVSALISDYSVRCLKIPKSQISLTLQELGIPCRGLGHDYLCESIRMVLQDPRSLHAVTTVIYPQVAKTFYTSESSVSRSIRSAIEAAWDRGNRELLDHMFKHAVSKTTGVPTNSEFIARVVSRVKEKDALLVAERQAGV